MQGIGRKSQSKEIGGCKYAVTQLGGIDSGNALLRLTKCVGPSLGALANPNSSLADVFTRLELSPQDLEYFRELFAPLTFVTLPDGKHPRLDHVFDDHFTGRTVAQLQWFYFCIEVNFADFLGELRTRFASAISERGAAPKAWSPSASPSTSTGSSGASSPMIASASPSES